MKSQPVTSWPVMPRISDGFVRDTLVKPEVLFKEPETVTQWKLKS